MKSAANVSQHLRRMKRGELKLGKKKRNGWSEWLVEMIANERNGRNLPDARRDVFEKPHFCQDLFLDPFYNQSAMVGFAPAHGDLVRFFI